MITLTHIKLMIVAVLLVGSFFAGYYLADLRADKQALELMQSQHQAIADARARADKAVFAAQQAQEQVRIEVIEKEKVITRDVIQYIKSPSHTVCRYDDERVRIKANILTNADPRSPLTE